MYFQANTVCKGVFKPTEGNILKTFKHSKMFETSLYIYFTFEMNIYSRLPVSKPLPYFSMK